MPSECRNASRERDLRPHLGAIQGEGPATGRRCTFVRLAICPLRCSWCDTAYTWAYTPSLALKHRSHIVYDRDKEIHEMAVADVVAQAAALTTDSGIVVLSGGEPLAQVPPRLQDPNDWTAHFREDDPVGALVDGLGQHNIQTHIETAGIRRPSPYLHQGVAKYVVSPKLATSGNSLATRRNLSVLEFFAGTQKADFKFVITEPEDFSEVQYLASLFRISPERIWVMPEGTTAAAIQRKLPMVAEGALKRGYNVSGRLHVQIWGEARAH